MNDFRRLWSATTVSQVGTQVSERTGIRYRPAAPQRPVAGRIPMRAQIGEGIRQVAGSRPLRSIALAAAITNLFGRLMVVLVPLYLVREAGYRGSPPGRSVPSPPEDNIIVLLVAYSEPPFQNMVLCEFVVRPD